MDNYRIQQQKNEIPQSKYLKSVSKQRADQAT